MDPDTSLSALFKPGDATTYFEVRDRPFDAEAIEYSRVNAWWLAELARLIYRAGPEEPEPSRGSLTRRQVLAELGLTEDFRQSPEAQFSLIAPADRRFAIVVFRGSHNLRDWVTNLDVVPVPCHRGRGRVHDGFQRALETVWGGLEELLRGRTGPLFFTGHSLGAALAILAAARHGGPSQLYTFGSPAVGDQDFLGMLARVSCHRVVNHLDIVTTLPPGGIFPPIGAQRYIEEDGRVVVKTSGSDPSIAQHHRLLQDFARYLITDPKRLTDHAPVNYVAHLQRAL